jgi:hypothetical protein
MATTEEEVIDLVRETRIDWAATPQSVMGPESEVIKSQGDLEAYQQHERDLVGYGYFYIDVRNMEANLALMHSTRPGLWQGEIIPQQYSPLLPHDLERAIEEAAGAMNWSGHYPLDERCRAKLQESYLGEL